MEQLLNSEETNFETLLLTKTEYLNCLVEEDEIFFRNSMYDIKSVSVEGDHVRIVAVNDTKETGLLDVIKKIAGASGLHHQQLPQPLQQLMSLLFVAPLPPVLNYSRSAESVFFETISQSTTHLYSEISTPPPQIF